MKQNLQQGKKFYNTGLFLLMLFLGVTVLAACSESQKAPVQPSAVSKSLSLPITQGTPTVAGQKATAEFSYNPAGRRDPFSPLITKEENRARESSRPPLERYNISEFKLTGIIWGGYGYNAMVEGPDGKGYFVREGTTIGPNKGVVKSITKDAMIIEEKFKNMMGATERKQIVIQLRAKQEGMQ